MELGCVSLLPLLLAKCAFLMTLMYGLYLLNWLILTPLRKREFYKKYPNVKMSEKFYPLVGDIASWSKNLAKGLGVFHHYTKEVAENPKIDFRLLQLGERSILEVSSPKALDQMEKLIPEKIDRGEPKNTVIDHMMPTAFVTSRTIDTMNKRKKSIIGFLGINRVSTYIPKMLESVDAYLKPLKGGQEVNFGDISKRISFEVMGTHLLGDDYKTINMDFKYVSPQTGAVSNVKFADFFMKLGRDEFAAFTNPLTKVLTPLSKRHLIEPFKTNHKNNLYLRKRLLQLIEASTDPNSMYKTLMRAEGASSEEALMDVLAVVNASFDSTSRVVSSCMYYLKKNPHVYRKLVTEIRKAGLDRANEIPAERRGEAFQDCDYLAYVVKEALRIDAPAPITLTYKAYEDINLCGVDIPEGQELSIGIAYPHFNPEQWHRPTEFLPERFDPESELFFKPGTKSIRHPKSFNAFSMGKRKCVGQTLAMLTAKVILVRILTTVKYEVSDDLMGKEKPCFDMFSATDLKIIIT